MKELTKNNILEFLEYYHDLHDSNITMIEYDISKAQITLIINVYWSGEPKLKDDGNYETNKKKIKIIFEGVEKVKSKEICSYEYIDDVYFKFIMLNNKEYICFADYEENPTLYIVSENAKYKEI